jgi:Fe-Mn family superoxide dismutase
MMIHHGKHHAGYTAKLNIAIKDLPVAPATAGELLRNASKYNAAIINNAGGYLNHKMYWKFMSPDGGGNPDGPIAKAIQKDFGSFEKFKEKFSHAAKKHFGSGWVWLIYKNGNLKITATANQDNPIMDTLPEYQRGKPLLTIDVWEHAYYLKYQNKRAEYIDAFWNVVNWKFVNKKFLKATEA